MESLGNSFIVCVILLILSVPNVTKYYYHDKGSVQFYTQDKRGVDSVVWAYIVLAHEADTVKMGDSLAFLLSSVFLILQNVVIFTQK